MTAQLNVPPTVRSELLSVSWYAIGSPTDPFGWITGEVIDWNCLRTVSTRPAGAFPVIVEW